MRQDYQDGQAMGLTIWRPGLAVGIGDIQAIVETNCAGCGVHLAARSFIDNITGLTWCSNCGDARNPGAAVHP
jgi:hypothetical protein